MPTSIATPKVAVRTEFHYREHPLIVSRGCPVPQGATPTPSGINFVLICRHGTAVWLVLAEAVRRRDSRRDPARPAVQSHRRPLARPRRRSARGVLLRLPGRRPQGQRPSLRSPDHPARPVLRGRCRAAGPGATGGNLPRRSLMTESMIDRQRVVNPRTPLEDTIIYELHVRGYTIDPSSGVKHPGTYAGLAEKIDELKDLGITAVELLPVDEFDENDCPFVNPLTGEKLRNFWGYNPIAFCAPRRPMPTIPSGPAHGTNSATWSTRFTRPGSRFTWTSCSTTRPRGVKTARPTTSAASTTRSSTCWMNRAVT